MQPYVRELVDAVEAASPRLLAMSDEAAARRPAPGKWSAKEIVGHLIDSASNNHQRFVRAQLKDDLLFDGYEQDGWVERQRYVDAPWTDLVSLWRLYNLHLAHVMAAASEDDRLRPRAAHSLDRVAFTTVEAGQPATLDYFMGDYVTHLKHHLTQIFGAH